MNTRTRWGLVALVLFVPGAGADDDEKYTSKDGQYAIRFPASGTVKSDTRKTQGVELNIATVKAGGATYIVTYIDLPEVPKDAAAARAIFDGAEKGGVATTGAKIEHAKDFEFGPNKYPAREIVADKDGNKMRSRLVLAGARLYLITVGGPKDFATSKEATAFLDSFEITK